MSPVPHNRLEPKPVSASRVVMPQRMLPPDANAAGNVHGGVILKHIDTAGGIAAIRHARSAVVTASIDRMDFLQPAYIGEVVTFLASVNLVGKTSMEVGVRVECENPMLYSKKPHFFDRYESDFLGDIARVVSLTVGRRLELGRDTLAKAAGGMAHVGNNVLAIMKNGAELIMEDFEDFLDHEDDIATGLIAEAMQLVPGPWPPLAPAAMRHLFGLAVERLEVEKKLQYVNLIVENINRLKQAIGNLLSAVDNPILMGCVSLRGGIGVDRTFLAGKALSV